MILGTIGVYAAETSVSGDDGGWQCLFDGRTGGGEDICFEPIRAARA